MSEAKRLSEERLEEIRKWNAPDTHCNANELLSHIAWQDGEIETYSKELCAEQAECVRIFGELDSAKEEIARLEAQKNKYYDDFISAARREIQFEKERDLLRKRVEGLRAGYAKIIEHDLECAWRDNVALKALAEDDKLAKGEE